MLPRPMKPTEPFCEVMLMCLCFFACGVMVLEGKNAAEGRCNRVESLVHVTRDRRTELTSLFRHRAAQGAATWDNTDAAKFAESEKMRRNASQEAQCCRSHSVESTGKIGVGAGDKKQFRVLESRRAAQFRHFSLSSWFLSITSIACTALRRCDDSRKACLSELCTHVDGLEWYIEITIDQKSTGSPFLHP